MTNVSCLSPAFARRHRTFCVPPVLDTLVPRTPSPDPGFKLKISERGYFPRIDDEELQMVLFRSQEIRWAGQAGKEGHQKVAAPAMWGAVPAQCVVPVRPLPYLPRCLPCPPSWS